MLAEFADIDLDSFPDCDTASAICVDHGCEVIVHGLAIRHVDRDAFPNGEEGRKTEFGNTLHIAFRVPTDVLVHERGDRRWHGQDSCSCSGDGQRGPAALFGNLCNRMGFSF